MYASTVMPASSQACPSGRPSGGTRSGSTPRLAKGAMRAASESTRVPSRSKIGVRGTALAVVALLDGAPLAHGPQSEDAHYADAHRSANGAEQAYDPYHRCALVGAMPRREADPDQHNAAPHG